MKISIASILYGLLIVSVEVQSLYRKWLPNANFGNPNNWNVGRIPCGNDKAVMPDEGPVVYYQLNATLKEIMLPLDGQIVFGPGSSLAFTNEADDSVGCQSSSSEVDFNVTYPADWMDFRNWCTMNDATGNCQTNNALDSEMVPCRDDDVIFPPSASYFVNLESHLSINVYSLKLDGRSYTSSKFASYLNSSDGSKMFPAPSTEGSRSSVSISGRKCSDPTGCPCGNDETMTLDSICKFRTPYCPKIQCLSPIKPHGGCCEMCGAILTIVYRSGFRLTELRNGLYHDYLDGKSQYSGVKYIVSKLSNNNVQLVLSDTAGSESIQVGTAIKAELDADIVGGFKYSIRSVTMVVSSGNGRQPVFRGSPMPGGEVAAIILGIILIVAMVSLGFVSLYRKRRSGDDFGFKVFDHIKFRSPARKPRMEVPPSFVFRIGSDTYSSGNTGASSSQGFDNPMYGTQPNDKQMTFELKTSGFGDPLSEEEQPTFDNSLGFDNPLYENLQESGFSDPTEVKDNKLDDKKHKEQY